MDKIGKIKLSMAKLGWNIEERISDDGWGDSMAIVYGLRDGTGMERKL